MDIECNEPSIGNRLSPNFLSSVLGSDYSLFDKEVPDSTCEHQPTVSHSRKRKLMDQYLQNYDVIDGNLNEEILGQETSMLQTNDTSTHWLPPDYIGETNNVSDSTGGRNNLTNSGEGVSMDDHLDSKPNFQHQFSDSLPKTYLSLSTSRNQQQHDNERRSQQEQSVTTSLSTMDQPKSYCLEHVGVTAASACVDLFVPTYTSTTVSTPSGNHMYTTDAIETDQDTALLNEYDGSFSSNGFVGKYQCLDCTTRNSACVTRTGYLDSTSFEHKSSLYPSQRQSCHHPTIYQQQDKSTHSYHTSRGLYLDLKNMPVLNIGLTQEDEKDLPMTPALFSPTLANALDDIQSITTTTTPTKVKKMDQETYLDFNINNDSHHTTAPFLLTDMNPRNTTFEQTTTTMLDSYSTWLANERSSYQDHTSPLNLYSTALTTGRTTGGHDQCLSSPASVTTSNDDFHFMHRRRSSNNTMSTNSSISDSLVTPRSHSHVLSLPYPVALSPVSVAYPYEQQQQQHQASFSTVSPLSTTTTSSSAPIISTTTRAARSHYIGNSCFHTMSTSSGSSSLAVLDEEEESRIFKQQQEPDQRPLLLYPCLEPNYQHIDIDSHQEKIVSSPLEAHSTTSKSSMYDTICNYLASPNLATSGEMKVVISTSKVAQKSYGTEKRFLCPPPSVLLYGSNWWTVDHQENQMDETNQKYVLRPPVMQIQMSNEVVGNVIRSSPVPAGNIEWITLSGLSWNEETLKTTVATTTATTTTTTSSSSDYSQGDSIPSTSTLNKTIMDPTAARSVRMTEPIVSGRCISKNMYISDNDEKRKTVEMLVRLRLANGLDLGVFKSKEIRVISKPSKKRQTLKNMELCIHHGTPVALFNRIRSQTVSTRYLGISNMDGTPIFYENYQPWGFNNNKQQRWKNTSQICFSSKTQTWDSFLIWIVDGSRIATEEEQEANGTSYPPPPAMALRLSSSESPVPIHYNQPVVLQCLNTGLVSPVMIIRKVDYGCSAIGGMRANNELLMRQPGCLGLGGEYNDECLGDPVSQLHKVAFQVIDNPSTLKGFSGLYPMDHQQQDHHKTCSSTLPYLDHPANYLSCMKDVVGIYCTSGQRQTLSSVTPGTKNMSTEATSFTGDNNNNIDRSNSSYQEKEHRSSPPATVSTPLPFSWSASAINHDRRKCQQQQVQQSLDDGSPAFRKRRVSCDIIDGNESRSTTSAAKQSVRRRYSSANEQTRSLQCGGTIHRRRNSILSSTNPSGLFSNGISGIWQEDISETCVWCIVNTDTETYTFLPSRMDETQNGKDDIPVTPVPYIKQWRMIENNRMIIHGYGFTNDMVVWFGTHVAMMIRITPTELEILVPSILLGIKKNEGTLQHEEKHGKKGSQGKRTNSKDHHQENDMGKEEWIQKKVPILIVREGDGMVYRTPKWF